MFRWCGWDHGWEQCWEQAHPQLDKALPLGVGADSMTWSTMPDSLLRRLVDTSFLVKRCATARRLLRQRETSAMAFHLDTHQHVRCRERQNVMCKKVLLLSIARVTVFSTLVHCALLQGWS